MAEILLAGWAAAGPRGAPAAPRRNPPGRRRLHRWRRRVNWTAASSAIVGRGARAVSDQEMSLHAATLGGGEEGYRAGRMIEGLLMAQVALALDRFGVPDLLAAAPVSRLVRRDAAGRYTLTSTGELFRTDSETSAKGRRSHT